VDGSRLAARHERFVYSSDFDQGGLGKAWLRGFELYSLSWLIAPPEMAVQLIAKR
jgi:hypothetical protein